MRKSLNFGLRARLLLLVFLAVVPALGLALYSAAQYRAVAAARVEEDTLQLAQVAAAAQERQFHGTEELLTALAQVPEVRGGDHEACTTFLAMLLKQYPGYTVLALADLKGDVVSSAVPSKQKVNVADRLYFKRAIATRAFSVGEYQVSRLTGKEAINCGYPVCDANGKLLGIVFAGLDLVWLEHLGTEAHLPAGATLTIVDGKGVVLLRYPTSPQWRGKHVANHPLWRAAASMAENGTLESSGLDGVPRIYGMVALTGPAAGIRVLVGMSRVRAFAEVEQIGRRNLVLLCCVALLVISAALLGAHFFVLRQVDALITASRRLSTSNLGTRTGLEYAPDEFGELAKAFDEMAETLQREVTELERAEQTLRMNEYRLQTLLKLSEMTRASFQEITDFALEEAVRLTSSTIGYLAFLNDDESVLTMHSWSKTAMAECAIIDKPIIYPVVNTGLWGEAVRQRKPVLTNDYLAPNPLKKGCPEGHVAVARHMNIPVFDGERMVAVAGVGNKQDTYNESDVTQLRLLMDGMWRLVHRRRAEEALRQLNDELEHRVAERTAELQRSNEQLEQFAYVASHDLQEPLRMVSSYVQLLEQRYQGKLDQDADDFIGFAVDGATRMSALIQDLLNYSRVGTRGAEFRPVKANEALEVARGNLGRAIEESRAEITCGELPEVMADRSQLVQLFQNLLSNAIKFHGEQPPRIRVEAQEQPDDWLFTVSDNGIGFDMSYASRVFVIFQRLHGRGAYPGTGIGLSICQKIVERHGGQIWVESQPGQGSMFSFTLPRRQEAQHVETVGW